MDAFLGLLPYATQAPLLLGLVVYARAFASTAKDLREERLDHQRTQAQFDAERELRRQVEDKLDAFGRKISSLEAEIGRLRKQLDEVTAP